MKRRPQKIGWFFFDPKTETVLLHRRDHRAKQSPSMWDCFGGKIEKGEGPEKAFIRELYEELGIRIPKDEIISLIKDKNKYIYYIHFPDWLTGAIRLGEGAGYAWFSIEDVFKLTGLTDEACKILSKFEKKVLNSSVKRKCEKRGQVQSITKGS